MESCFYNAVLTTPSYSFPNNQPKIKKRKTHLYNNPYPVYNTIKDPQWYDVQEGDATMYHIASSLPGQKNKKATVFIKNNL